jgi:hypothetical protein
MAHKSKFISDPEGRGKKKDEKDENRSMEIL